ncbi:hypothetical protein SHO565_42660 [Streptomyces sp. HO565]
MARGARRPPGPFVGGHRTLRTALRPVTEALGARRRRAWLNEAGTPCGEDREPAATRRVPAANAPRMHRAPPRPGRRPERGRAEGVPAGRLRQDEPLFRTAPVQAIAPGFPLAGLGPVRAPGLGAPDGPRADRGVDGAGPRGWT